jgi:hypothetical protein
MKKNNTIAGWLLLLALASLNFQRSTCFAQGTAFTYQGQLNANGSTANGLYDLRFQVWDALTNGNLIAGPLTNSATGVTNGLFTITLDFGPGVFTGPGRWLELDVRTNGTGAFTTLLPLQPVLPVPYALYAMTPAGPTGPQGPTGPTGPQGLPGTNGVVSLNGLINAVTLAAGTNVTLTTKGNTLQISAINFIPHMQVFTASGTFMVPAGVSNIMVEILGGGGGGSSGWTNQGISPTYVPGNGGGGGGYGKQVFNVLPGSNLPVVVGPGGGPDSSGGDSNFNNGAVIAHGGQKGVFGSTGSGGSGGSCNATFNITGAPGGTYQSIYSTMVGDGGAAGCGGFGGNLTINGGVPGGGGGGGAWNYTGGQYISIPAGSGANGRVIINY